MKRFVLGVLFGLVCTDYAFASMTPLCEEVYGEEHYGDSSLYGENAVLSETYTVDSAAGIGELQKAQIIKLGRANELFSDEEASDDEKVNTILANTDDENTVYQVITVTTTGTSYEQYRIYLGDTEVSALFVKGTLFMVARTSDAECYQDDTTDEVETAKEPFFIERKQWIDFGPFENKESLHVALERLTKGVHVSLYVRKGEAPTFSNYDCRKKSQYDSDMSCDLTGEGDYYAAVYRYSRSRGEPVENLELLASFAKEKEAATRPIKSSGMLAKGKKHYLGPFHADSSFTAVLGGLKSGVYTNLYVTKGSQAEYWDFDCRKSSRTDDELSCRFEEPGDYYIQIYRSKISGGDAFEFYAVDVTIDAAHVAP